MRDFARALARAFAAALALAPAFSASAEGAEGIVLPSGRAASFLDTIWGTPGPAGLTVRFRFVEPELAAVIDATPYDDLEADLHFLCESYALERIASTGPQPAQVIVSIADRPTEFGAADPDVRQVFEAYRPEDGTCVWEGW